LPLFVWWFETQVFDKAAVAKTYFPFYGIIFFGLCMFGIVVSNFEIYFVAFYSASFFTTSQSWVWFVKAKNP